MAIHRLSAATLSGIAFARLAANYATGHFVTDWLVVRTLVAPGWVVTFCTLAWVRLDETAREAHRFVWMYGGGAGLHLMLMLMLIALMAVIWSPGAWEQLATHMSGFAPAVAEMPEPLAGFAAGLIACAIAQVIGYVLVWGGWWTRRR